MSSGSKVRSILRAFYEKYDYPGRYKRDEQGKPFSQYRLEYERREAEVAFAKGDDLRVVPGYVFELEGHRRADFNRPWLIVAIDIAVINMVF